MSQPIYDPKQGETPLCFSLKFADDRRRMSV